MQAIITRPMVIATDAGTSKQFMPAKDVTTGEDIPQTMSEGEFNRLRRASAAQRFIEVNHAETEEPAGQAGEGSALHPAIQELGNSDAGTAGIDEAGAGGNQSETETVATVVTPELPVKPRTRKAK